MRWRGDESPDVYVRPFELAVLEESTELLASLLVLLAIVRFVAKQRDMRATGARIPWLSSPMPWVPFAAGWLVRMGWDRIAAANFEVRLSYLDPAYWLGGAALTLGGLVAWIWWRFAGRGSSPALWIVALVVYAVLLGADYGSGLALRSLAGHAVGSAGVSAVLSLAALAFGVRWLTNARTLGERVGYGVWVGASVGAAWLAGPGSALCVSVAWTAFVDAVLKRPEWTDPEAPMTDGATAAVSAPR